MEEHAHSVPLDDFVESILEPLETFSGACMFSPSQDGKGIELTQYELGLIISAFMVLIREQLGSFAVQLEAQYGPIYVVAAKNKLLPLRVVKIVPR